MAADWRLFVQVADGKVWVCSGSGMYGARVRGYEPTYSNSMCSSEDQTNSINSNFPTISLLLMLHSPSDVGSVA